MGELGMTREQFAHRIGTKKRTLDNWLLSLDSGEYRSMPDMGWKFVWGILEPQSKKRLKRLIAESRHGFDGQTD